MAQENKDTSLTGRLLLAMPGLQDPRFHKAVILMCAHDEKGAMGLVINHLLPGVAFKELLDQLNIEMDDTQKTKAGHVPILSGGPVETERGFVLHTHAFEQPDTIKIDQTLSVTGTIDALRLIASGEGPEDMLFILGYAGWGEGQLDKEIQENSWLVMDADSELIFNDAANDKWDSAVRKMGIDPAMLSTTAGHS